MIARTPLALVIALAMCLSTARAAADEDPAKQLFEEGQRLFEAGQVDAACDTFGKSLAVVRTAGTLINLARCHAAQGKNALAWREYREVEQLANAAGQGDRAKVAADLAVALEPKLGKLRIAILGSAEGLLVFHNGDPWPAIDAPSFVDPGRHDLEARAPGALPWRTSVDVAAGEEATVRIPDLDASGAPEEPASPPDQDDDLLTIGIVVGAAGVVAAVVGGVLGAMTLSEVREAEADDALCGADQRCTPAGIDHIASAEKKGIASTVLLGVGAAAVVTGAILVIVGLGDDAPPGDVAFAPWVDPTGAGVHLGARF